ncbi:T9SS type A sorting domain-containing protein [candidate division KSB1 bacterium]|nr:T9SS type A sorting domain-containing protein [candidate division KSB1 bacterium]
MKLIASILCLAILCCGLVSISTAETMQGTITLEQLHLLNMDPPVYYSTAGLFTFTYTPEEEDAYLNIRAVHSSNPALTPWIVRNLYLPNNSGQSGEQSISVRFDLTPFGFEAGDQVGGLFLYISKTDTVLPSQPESGEFHPLLAVDTLGVDAYDSSMTVNEAPPMESFDFYTEFPPGDTVSILNYRGCSVPNIDLDDGTNPDTDTYAGDRNACGPASAANSMKWLDDTYEEISTGLTLRDMLEELSEHMNRGRNLGVLIEDFIRGKLDFIEAYGLPINVKFQSAGAVDNISSSSGETAAHNQNQPASPYPTWDWLVAQIEAGEDVEVMYFWEDGDDWRGHAVVVTGYEETPNSRKTLKFKHDVRQRQASGTRQEMEDIVIDSHGRMVLRSRGAFIAHAVSESVGTPYPVELSSFEAKVVGTSVYLQWQTESESSNYGFRLHRNGKEIAFIQGTGTTQTPQRYEYEDKNLQAGAYTYRLEQVDTDGSAHTVGTLTKNIGTIPRICTLQQNYPNPFNSSTMIAYSLPEQTNVTLTIYDILGNKITTLVKQKQDAGQYQFIFDAQKMASGIYFYQLKTENSILTKKLILIE